MFSMTLSRVRLSRRSPEFSSAQARIGSTPMECVSPASVAWSARRRVKVLASTPLMAATSVASLQMVRSLRSTKSLVA